MTKYVVAPDSFKESMTAKEVCDAMEKGIKIVDKDAQVIKVPMADGGEGTVDSLVDATHGQRITVEVTGPLGNKIRANYGILGNGTTAVIEMAKASGLDQLRQFAAGAKLFSVTQNASKKLEDATVKQTTYTKLLNAINGIASALFGLIIFVLTGFLVKNGLVQMSTLLIVGNFRFYLNQAINEISQARGEMKGVKSLIEEVNEAAEKVQVSDKQKTNMPTVIKTESLRLNFPNGEKLSYPDIQINQGEKILLTGDSGTGKSTLFKLILGELAPSAGKIIFEDKDGNEINPDLKTIGYLPQDPVIFPASIKENITMFNNKLDNKVEKSVEEVNLSADLQKFEEGINKQLDLDKLNISGGQRQKIVLARAQVHESDIILIDEGTSAIDQNSTIDILDKLLKSKATIVFIAHNFTEEMHELFDREIHLIKE